MSTTGRQPPSAQRRDQVEPSAPKNWRPPELNPSELRHRFGNSVLLEFIRGHSSSAILHELVQNEYDAGGSVLHVSFGETGLDVSGNGKPIDRKGWRRLSVTLGTGSVPELSDPLEEKANGIGSKNFGLRSLFFFGDRIFVRSNGYQTLLDILRGTPKAPHSDPTTIGTLGVRIHVPYRTNGDSGLHPFTIDAEADLLDELAEQISSALIKLAHHSARRGLRQVIVSSVRKNRQIVWRQYVKQLTDARRGVKLFVRRITMSDSKIEKTQSQEEFEWQKQFRLPEEFSAQHVPGYFRARRRSITIGLSLRTKKAKLHPEMPPGIAYYPIGVEHAYTGNGVSISAPFEMDADRSQVVDPANSPFNAWLLRLACEMTLELLRTDWIYRFGMGVYRAVGEISRSALSTYSEAIANRLRNDACWPSRNTAKGKKTSIQFAPIRDLNVISRPSLDYFLDADQYLHPDMVATSALYQLSTQYGVKQFTVNALVRLRCAGEASNALQSILRADEANYHCTDFPDNWLDLSSQQRCAVALDDCHKQLSKDNRRDLAASPTTLTACNTLDAAENLWFIPDQIQDSCPVPEDNRLHPALSGNRVLRSLCKPFDVTKWMDDVIGKIQEGEADERERVSLYRYIISVNGRVPRKLLTAVRGSPVLRNHKGDWVSPRSITAAGTTGMRRYRSALHLPHRDYAKDLVLARTLRFKKKITGDDVVRFAQLVSESPEIAPEFERVLERSSKLLTASTVRRLAPIAFIRTNEGELGAPPSVYIDTPRNKACIGPEGPFPAGSAKKLFSRLGCTTHPDHERIVQYLETLRENGQSPPRSDILYPELVVALKRDSAPAIYKDDEILWTGSGYSSPAATILGEEWSKIFLDNVPIVKTSSRTLARAYRELGVRDRPEQHHWEQLFLSVGERYLEEPSPLPTIHRSALRKAYVLCEDVPSLPPHIPWLLDENGHLHTARDSAAGRFVIEDDVPLGTAIRKSSIPISFASNSDSSVTSFFRMQGVNLLTEMRNKVRDRVSEFKSAPTWFQEKEYIQILSSTNFRSALEAMAARDFMGSPNALKRIRETADRLAQLEQIAFVQDIFADYRVGRKQVTVAAKYAWTHNTIHLAWVRSRSRLEGMLASLIARECLPDERGDDARFSDSIFRLIT